jgi:hypothetical protein
VATSPQEPEFRLGKFIDKLNQGLRQVEKSNSLAKQLVYLDAWRQAFFLRAQIFIKLRHEHCLSKNDDAGSAEGDERVQTLQSIETMWQHLHDCAFFSFLAQQSRLPPLNSDKTYSMSDLSATVRSANESLIASAPLALADILRHTCANTCALSLAYPGLHHLAIVPSWSMPVLGTASSECVNGGDSSSVECS